LRNKPRLVAPLYDECVYIWFYLVLRTVTHYVGPKYQRKKKKQNGAKDPWDHNPVTRY